MSCASVAYYAEKADRFTHWYISKRNILERQMPGWTIRPPGILAKGFFIRAGMSTLQNYSCCSSKGVVDVKKKKKKTCQVKDLSG